METTKELASPHTKLKDILHTIFKKNDQQVAEGLISAQVCQEHDPGVTTEEADALSATLDAAATSCVSECAGDAASAVGASSQQQPSTRRQRQQQPSATHSCCSSSSGGGGGCCSQRDSATALDADGGVAAAGAAAAVTTTELGPSVPALAECTASQPASNTAHHHMQQQLQHEHGSTLVSGPVAPTMHSAPCPNGSRPASCAGASTSGMQHMQPRKALCASVDDLYHELFGDVPLPSTASSSTAQSPYGGSFIGVRGVSSMSPMTTSSAFCQHQHAAAAAIAGNGGMPCIDGTLLALPGSPSPLPGSAAAAAAGGMGGYTGASNASLCSSSYAGGADGVAAGGDCGQSGGSSLAGPVAMQASPFVDDLCLPPGLYPPKIRVGLINTPPPPPAACCVGASDGGSSSSAFPAGDDDYSCGGDEGASPSYCSSSAGGGGGGTAWPALSTDGGDSTTVAVSSPSSQQAWGSRGSLRYGSPAHQHTAGGSSAAASRGGNNGASPAYSASAGGLNPRGGGAWSPGVKGTSPAAAVAQGSQSAPGGSAEGLGGGSSKPKTSLRARWSNWINGSSGGGGGGSSSARSPRARQLQSPLQLQKQKQPDHASVGQTEQEQERRDHSQQQQQQEDEQALSALWLTSGLAQENSIGQLQQQQQRGSTVCAVQSAPGNAAAQALYNSMGGTRQQAATCATAAGTSSGRQAGQHTMVGGSGGSSQPSTGGVLHQLVHCHSNPELVQSAMYGSVGHGRPHFQRTTSGLRGAGGGGVSGGGPPCARSLFGSVPQMERPLMMAAASSGAGGGSNHNSSHSGSGWLSGPGGVGFGLALHRSESFGVMAALGGCADDAMSVASADEEVIRQVNADNVLSTAWGPGSHHHSAAGGASGAGAAAAANGAAALAGSGSGSLQQQPLSLAPKLLAFKYCCATSPLNHPGRSSPFGSTRNSPFNSPRGTRDLSGVADLLPLRSAAAAAATNSCPGSPLGAVRHSNPFSSSTSTPSTAGGVRCISSSDGKAAPAAAAAANSSSTPQASTNVLKKQSSGSAQQGLSETRSEPFTGNLLDQQQQPSVASSAAGGGWDGSSSTCPTTTTSSGSGGGGGSMNKPPLQSRPVRGLLRTPPPPLPLPTPVPPPTAAEGTYEHKDRAAASAPEKSCCAAADAADTIGQDGSSSEGGQQHGVSALMLRLGSSGGSADSAQQQQQGLGHAAECDAGDSSRSGGSSSSAGVSTSSRSGSSSSLLLPLPSCSIDVPASASAGGSATSSPKQQLGGGGGGSGCSSSSAGGGATTADVKCSPRRQSSSRLGINCGFTTPSRLSHNSTMGESLVAASSGGGGFGALQRTSSCCSSSSGWVVGGTSGAGGSSSAKRASGRGCGGSSGSVAAAGRDDAGVLLLGAASVPLIQAYCRDPSREERRSGDGDDVNCSNSSDGSWGAGEPEADAAGSIETLAQQQQQQQHEDAAAWRAAVGSTSCLSVAVLTTTTVTAAGGPAAGRYDNSCNGASDTSAADCQDCPYPSWCSSSCLSPGAPSKQQQQQHHQQEQHQGRQHGRQQTQPQTSSTGSDADAVGAGAEGGAQNMVVAAAQQCIFPSLPEVDFLEKIGRGSFGDVFKGVWCGSVVAVKVIQVKQPSALTFPYHRAAHSTAHHADDMHEQHHQQQDALSQQHVLVGGGDTTAMATAAAGGTSTSSTDHIDSQAAQVALELAQHEYESWLNANLRHPNIVQLFTSFTIGLEEPRGPLVAPPPHHPLLAGGAGGCGGGSGGDMMAAVGGGAGVGMTMSVGGGLSWRTHLVMEYCELGTMQDLLQRGVFSAGSLPAYSHLCWVLATAKEFCTAVCYLHSMDVVHGDLKSSNVLLKAAAATPWDSRGFVAKVSDFGLSRVMDAISAANGEPPSTPSALGSCCGSADADGSTASDTSAAAAAAAAQGAGGGGGAGGGSLGGSLSQQPCQPRFGALSHAAPELIQGQELSKASDVYSIGVLLWELLTGQPPFYGMHPGQLLSRKLSQHTSQLLPFPQATPPGLAQLCLDCWAQDASQRPSMTAVVSRINDLAVTLLGQEQAVAMFPDVAASLAAQRRSAAIAGGGAGGR